MSRIALCLFLTLGLTGCASLFDSRPAGQKAADEFAQQPTEEHWKSLLAIAQKDSADPDAQLARHIRNFADARLKRDQLMPTTVPAKASLEMQHQVTLANSELGIIRYAYPNTVWTLLKPLVCQTFDNELGQSASELAYRLNSAQFAVLKSQTADSPEADDRMSQTLRKLNALPTIKPATRPATMPLP